MANELLQYIPKVLLETICQYSQEHKEEKLNPQFRKITHVFEFSEGPMMWLCLLGDSFRPQKYMNYRSLDYYEDDHSIFNKNGSHVCKLPERYFFSTKLQK